MNIVQTAGKLGMLYLNRVIILIVQSIKIQIFNQQIMIMSFQPQLNCPI